MPAGSEVCDGEGVECRVNLWDNKLYSLRKLRRLCDRVDYTEEEVLAHWENQCAQITVASADPQPSVGEAAAVVAPAPQVEAWNRTWSVKSLGPMFTSADFGHVHAVSGAAYMVLGAAYLIDMVLHDIARLNGAGVGQSMPVEIAFLAMALGALNAGSGLQPALLARPKDLAQVLGLGPGGNPKTGGFVNASLFYFIFAYQGLRVLPAFPAAMSLLDPVVGLVTILSICHTALILNAWVSKIHRVDAVLVPSAMNLPVSLHLLFHGQAWIEQLAAAYPGWPELFFTANFALAWSACMVSFILSLHERRVISWELRGILMVLLPFLVFAVIPLHAMVSVPHWFQSDLSTMLMLIPPSPQA